MKKILDAIQNTINSKQFPMVVKILNISIHHENIISIDGVLIEDQKKIQLHHIRIPKHWGTKDGGILFLPEPLSLVLIDFIDGNINFPFIKDVLSMQYSDKDIELNTYLIKKNRSSLSINKKMIVYCHGDIKLDILEKGDIVLSSKTNKSFIINNQKSDLKHIILHLLSMIASIEISGSCGCVRNASNYPSPPGTLLKIPIIFNDSQIRIKIHQLFH